VSGSVDVGEDRKGVGLSDENKIGGGGGGGGGAVWLYRSPDPGYWTRARVATVAERACGCWVARETPIAV